MPHVRVVTPSGAEVELDGEVISRLAAAVRGLGTDELARREVVAVCRGLERRVGLGHGDVRETITGPIVDALYAPGEEVRKTLADGAVFDFSYRSKIARDFVLSPDEFPDHVWEPQTTKLLMHFARGAKHVAIGGGYIGDHAVLVARVLQGSGGVCHAFEPNAESAALMRRNAENNRVTNLRVNEVGLWNETATLTLVGSDSHARPVRADNAAGGTTFPAVSLDDYATSQGFKQLDLLMLDIEGGEQSALEGATRLLHGPDAPVVVFEVHRSYVDWSNGLANTDPVKLMTSAGYHVFAIRDFQSNVPMAGCLIELIPPDSVYLEGPPHGFNMLAVKNEASLDRGVFRVCRDRSPKLLLHKSPALHHPSEWLAQLPEWLTGDARR
jgi:FkbM family methyltransferase